MQARVIKNQPPLLLVGTAIAIAIAVLMPLTYLVMRAASISGEQLLTLVSRPRTLQVLLNSAGIAIATPLFSAAIAVPLAFLTWRTNLPRRRFWLIATTLPLAIPDYIGGFALIAAFAPKGSWLQQLLEPVGVQELPEIYGWLGTILALTLLTYPYLLLSVSAGLQAIDPAMEEAARSLGYGEWATFWQITIPQLRPSLVAGGLIVAMYALQDFGVTTLMRFDAFTRLIFVQYRNNAVAGLNTAELQMADNDYAVGLLVEKISKSPYWKDTATVVIEDDSQNGSDHVDGHRSVAYVISPYTKRKVLVSTNYNTINVLRTIEDLLGIDYVAITDANAVPMSDAFTRNPDFTPYTAVVPGNLCRQPVDPNLVPACNNPDAEKTAAIPSHHNKQWWAQATKDFFFGVEDKLDPEKFNRVLWAGIKGDKVAYPSDRDRADLRQNREQLLANWRLSQAQVVAQH